MSVFSQHPKSAFWSSKNTKTPNEVALNSHKKFWFDCDKCSHSFETTVSGINRLNRWCLFCANKKLCEDNECNLCFEKSFASHEKSKYLHDKTINPRTLFKNTNKKHWFDCDKCDHSFEMVVSGIYTCNRWCAYCAHQKLCEDAECKSCFENSFASHEKSKYLHNKAINPRSIFKNTHKKFLFDCDKCEHKFETRLLNINQQNSGCPYCSTHCVILCKDINCNQCFEKSFASHDFSNFWDVEKNGEIKPRDIFKYCDKKYWFNCDKCSHNLHIMIKGITREHKWCSYCSHQKLCEMTDCQLCFNNSFASVERSKLLHDKTINPRTLFKSTNKRFKFDCNLCNGVFETQLADITKGVWCPFCMNKTEQMLFDKLVLYYPLLKRQYKKDWCKKINYLPFDFVIEDLKIIIELDGKQHFEQIGNWMSPEKTQENDLYKMKCANENGFSIIRILQDDVFKDKYDWLTELCENIEKITMENRVQNIYMCKNNEYKYFDI